MEWNKTAHLPTSSTQVNNTCSNAYASSCRRSLVLTGRSLQSTLTSNFARDEVMLSILCDAGNLRKIWSACG